MFFEVCSMHFHIKIALNTQKNILPRSPWDPQNRGFSHFFMIFAGQFRGIFWKAKKTGKNSIFQNFRRSQARIDGVRGLLGRDLEMGLRTSELRLMRLAKLVTSYMIRLAFSTPCSPVGRRRMTESASNALRLEFLAL